MSSNLITFLPSHNLALSLIVVHVLLQVSGQNKCFLKSHQCHVNKAKKIKLVLFVISWDIVLVTVHAQKALLKAKSLQYL